MAIGRVLFGEALDCTGTMDDGGVLFGEALNSPGTMIGELESGLGDLFDLQLSIVLPPC